MTTTTTTPTTIMINDELDKEFWTNLVDQHHCPCLSLEEEVNRYLQELSGSMTDSPTVAPDEDDVKLWEVLYMCGVLLFMFIALLSDRIGADFVMLSALTLCMAAEIITIPEGLGGFANEGLMQVMVLFVVAEGISVTGALDWYMGKLLGRPSTIAGAQLRLMIPIAIISAFLNNTPVVAVMIPITQRWAKNIGISPQQLLIPLSFASILGGTCTLIGTSTNLVVIGLLKDRYPGDPELTNVGLFDLGEYGVPVAILGLTYILVASPFLLPGGRSSKSNAGGVDFLGESEDVLLGARLTQWSPAAGRSVKRSGLRDTGGIYLVSVHRAATGNVHRAVSQDFVVQPGDVLYFTGLVEGFGEFCEEHGLEVITNEIPIEIPSKDEEETDQQQQQPLLDGDSRTQQQTDEEAPAPTTMLPSPTTIMSQRQLLPSPFSQRLTTVPEAGGEEDFLENVPTEIGITKESLLQSAEADRMRSIHRLTDAIRGNLRSEAEELSSTASSTPRGGKLSRFRASHRLVVQSDGNAYRPTDPPKIVVTMDEVDKLQGLVVVGVNAHDRPGLLLDISKGLLRLNLQLRHTEAAVVRERSLSIWRCECIDAELPDLEEVWVVLNALLESDSGIEAMKKRGLRVIRAIVTKNSRLIGCTASEVGFREKYKAAIVAVQKGGKNVEVQKVRFAPGDVLILQASDNSPFLQRPPADFYAKLEHDSANNSKASSYTSLVNLVKRPFASRSSSPVNSSGNLLALGSRQNSMDEMDGSRSSPSRTSPARSPSRTPRYSAGAEIEEQDMFDPEEPVETTSGTFFIPAHLEDDYNDENNNNSNDDDYDSTDALNDVSADKSDLQQSIVFDNAAIEAAWRDLQVVFAEDGENPTSGGAEAMGAQREFLTAMEVSGNQLAGKTASQLGISKLPGVFLVSIDRPVAAADNADKDSLGRKKVISITSDASAGSSLQESLRHADPMFVTIAPEEVLQVGDVLWFSGGAGAVGDLRKIPGLKAFDNEQVEKIKEKIHDRRLVQAVIARKGPLVGKTVKEVRFRTKYGAAVIAIHREGQRVHDHPGNIKLQAGDVLLLEAGPTFIQQNVNSDKSFALLAEVQGSAPPRLKKFYLACVLTVAMLVTFTAGLTSLLIAALVTAILMVAFGILSQQEARDSLNWEVFLTIGAAFGIGIALTNSGVAGGVADFLVQVGTAIGIGDAGLYGAVYLATFLISNVVTNNAAAALLFPIAMDAAEQTGADLLLMSYTLMLGASASFMSPFGYTTNLLIYGPGGYKYMDFVKVGTPMQVVLWILSVVLLSVTVLEWYASWLITGGIFVVVAAIRLSNGAITKGMANKVKHAVVSSPTSSEVEPHNDEISNGNAKKKKAGGRRLVNFLDHVVDNAVKQPTSPTDGSTSL